MNDPKITIAAEYNRLLRVLSGEEEPKEGETFMVSDAESYFTGRVEGLGRALDLLGMGR